MIGVHARPARILNLRRLANCADEWLECMGFARRNRWITFEPRRCAGGVQARGPMSAERPMTAEEQRIKDNYDRKAYWSRWGPYLSERQWGTVREDYSADGDAWNYLPHEHARSRAYRWGEDGIGGVCDAKQNLCVAVALWNGKDPILKERMFGLSNREGNHGEDVKELYYYLDAMPTYSYARMLYKYPQAEFPYARLVQENARRSKQDPEFEIIDTGIFDG